MTATVHLKDDGIYVHQFRIIGNPGQPLSAPPAFDFGGIQYWVESRESSGIDEELWVYEVNA